LIELKVWVKDSIDFVEFLYIYSKLIKDLNEKLVNDAAALAQQNSVKAKNEFVARTRAQYMAAKQRAAANMARSINAKRYK